MGRPKRDKVSKLRSMTVADYTQLERACVQAIFSKQIHVILAVSHLTKFPDDFPKGVLQERRGDLDYRRIRVVKLLKWLNDNGYSTITTAHLRVAADKMTKALKEKGF